MAGSASNAPSHDLVASVSCPQCDEPVDVEVPDREVEPTVSAYVRAFGDHVVVHCDEGHRFWVYFC